MRGPGSWGGSATTHFGPTRKGEKEGKGRSLRAMKKKRRRELPLKSKGKRKRRPLLTWGGKKKKKRGLRPDRERQEETRPTCRVKDWEKKGRKKYSLALRKSKARQKVTETRLLFQKKRGGRGEKSRLNRAEKKTSCPYALHKL